MLDRREMNHFLKYQSIYAFILYVVVTWTLLGARITALENQQNKDLIQIQANQELLVDVQSRLASIETSIEFIKKAVTN